MSDSLALGGIYAFADIDDAPFNTKFVGLVRRFASLSGAADKFAASAAKVDDALAGTAATSEKVSTSTTRTTQTTTRSTTANEREAASLKARADAAARVNAVMVRVAGETTRVQQATLREAAAQERAAIAAGTGSREYARLASAQASVIGATRSLAAAQEVGAASGGRLSASMGGMLKTAGELGLVVGAIEGVKKAIDIGNESADFDAALTRIQTQAGATAGEVDKARGALLAMSGRVAQSPDALANSLYHVYSATKTLGYSLPQMLKAVEIAGRGATTSGADLEETTNSLTATLVAGLGPVNDMGKAMGALNTIVGVGDMKQEDLNAALSTGILVTAKTYGVTLSQAGAALAVFGDNNIRGANAATRLRMVIQDLSKPAADADAVLGKIGLTSQDLRDDLEKGGLSLALVHLKQKLEDAGITGDKVGGFLEDAFTKKAGAGLAILLNNLDQYDQKQRTIETAADDFGSKWAAATKTARFAFDQLGARIDAAGIKLAGKLTPAAAAAAHWLGTELPHALSILDNILEPTIHLVGDGLGGAWHVVAGTVKIAATALGGIGHFLESDKALVTGVATSVLAMWATFKLVSIATAAIKGINSLLETFRIRAMYAGDGLRAMSVGSFVAKGALGALGIAVGVLTYAWSKSSAEAAEQQAVIEAYTQAIEEDSGALGRNTREVVINNLEKMGAFRTAAVYGITQKTLTNAMLGSTSALKQMNAAFRDGAGKYGQDNAEKFLEIIRTTTGQLGKAEQAAKDHAAAMAHSSAATARAAAASHLAANQTNKNRSALDDLRSSTSGSTKATDRHVGSLKRDLTALEALQQQQLAMAQSEDSFLEAINGVTKQLHGNNDTLDTSTKRGLANRDSFLAAASAALSLKDAQDKTSASEGKGAAAVAAHTLKLAANIGALRKAAVAAGGDRGEIDKLLARMHLLPGHLRTKIEIDTYGAKANLQDLLNMEAKLGAHAPLSLAQGAKNAAGGRASGGGLPEGVSAVGERGPELAIKRGPHVDILSNPQSRRFLAATGMRAPGFAGGTGGPPITTGTSNGHEVWIVNGIRYASLMAAQNAQHRAEQLDKKLPGYGRHLLGGFRHLGHLLAGGSRSDFASQLGDIYGILHDAGVPHSVILGLRHGNKELLDAAGAADKSARHLASARKALAAARKAMRQDEHGFAGAVVGSFDITQAGADPVTGRVTRGSLLAQQAQAVTRARAYVSGMRKLIGLHLFPASYLRQLLNAGPDALPQVQALLGMPHAQLKDLANENRQLHKLGSTIGHLGGDRLDSGAVNRAGHRVDRAAKAEYQAQQHLSKELGHLGDRLEHKLDNLHMTASLGIKLGQLAVMVQTGMNQNRKVTRSGRP